MSDYLKIYSDEFYKDRDAATRYASDRIIEIVSELLPSLKSAADVGCGVGTWLSVLSEKGVECVRGFDGHWVDRDFLQISEAEFTEADLQNSIRCDRRFDLAISLEVAEHLPAECAGDFVSSLTGLSDFVLFSAAIPFQGGVNHLNEQWQSYWAEKFAANGYAAVDCVRSKIWDDEKISVPYRQNMILYVREERLPEIGLPASTAASLSLAHPRLYELRNSKSIRQALADLKSTTSRRIRNLVGTA